MTAIAAVDHQPSETVLQLMNSRLIKFGGERQARWRRMAKKLWVHPWVSADQ